MRVVDNRHPDLVDFDYLEVGAVFWYEEEAIWGMKIEEVKTTDSAHLTCNFVDLRTGELGYLGDCDQVEELPGARMEIN